MSIESNRDPRNQLVREKYFSIRPKPLERWLWSQGVPPAAERVFWLHWQEGQQRGDWCSQIPLKRVASECQLDLSTVTRAYQVLQRMECIRRTDPGRDPSNPFQQATAVTEVRVPRELLVELDRHPNRRAGVQGTKPPATLPVVALESPPEAAESGRPSVPDPFAGRRPSERMRALTQLVQGMSAAEQGAYHEAMRMHRGHMTFDADSKLAPETRAQILQLLMLSAGPRVNPTVAASRTQHPTPGPRKLSTFELARLRRDIQSPQALRLPRSCDKWSGPLRRERCSASAPCTPFTSRSRRSGTEPGRAPIVCRRIGPERWARHHGPRPAAMHNE
jgi:hypothetical protein